MIINPDKRNVNTLTLWLISESCLEPNKIKKNRSYPIITRKPKNYNRSYGKM